MNVIIKEGHCEKSIQIRSYLWSVFSCIRTEYGFTISVFSPDTGKYGPVFLLRWLPLKFIVVSLHFFRRLFADSVSTCCSSLRLVLFSSSRTFGRITRLFELSCNLEISAFCFQILSSNNTTLL